VASLGAGEKRSRRREGKRKWISRRGKIEMIIQMDLGIRIMGSFVRGQGELGMRIVLCPSPAYSNALKNFFESLDRGLADWDYNLDHHFAYCLQFGL
jgi:hypothetical protein